MRAFFVMFVGALAFAALAVPNLHRVRFSRPEPAQPCLEARVPPSLTAAPVASASQGVSWMTLRASPVGPGVIVLRDGCAAISTYAIGTSNIWLVDGENR